MTSNHYLNQRTKREKFIEEQLGGDGQVIDSFIVDKGHIRGEEIHKITDNGIIIIFNKTSGKMVSKLIARPQQIKRYYQNTGREPPEEYERILKLAKERNILGYNEI